MTNKPSMTPVLLVEDVARLIFEIGAASRDDFGLAWAMVSKPVKLWVEPILYRDVVVDKRGLFHRTVTAPTSTKPPRFFKTHVKALLFNVQSISGQSHIPEILGKCSSVRSLALQVTIRLPWPTRLLKDPGWQPHPQLASVRIAPTHLSIPASFIGSKNAAFKHPMFRAVTHLEISFTSATIESGWDWSALSALDKTTHLNFNLQVVSVNTFRAIVTHVQSGPFCPPHLRVAVISFKSWALLDDTMVLAINRGEVDPRLVVLHISVNRSDPVCGGAPVVSSGEWLNQWARPSATRTTLWTRVEGFMREREGRRQRDM